MGLVSRRALLMGGVGLVGVAGCSSPGQGSAVAGAGRAQPTAPSTPTPVALGVRRYSFQELGSVSGSGVKAWSSGPHAVVVATGRADQSGLRPFTILSSVIAGPWVPPVSLSSSQKAGTQLIAVEQDPAAEPASAHVLLTSKAGSGLAGSQYVLAVAVAQHRTKSVQQGECVVPVPADAEDGKPELVAAVMVGGVVVATLTWAVGRYLDAKYFAHRVAMSATGEKLWERTDNDNHNDSISAVKDTVLPCLRAQDLIAGAGVVVFGVDNKFVGVATATGKELYRAPGHYSLGGVIVQDFTHFGVNFYSDRTEGISLFRTADGSPVAAVKNAGTVAIDPVTGQIAAAYMITDGGISNDGPNIPGSPAVQVLGPDGAVKLTISRQQAAALGQPRLVCAFDGRMVLAIKDGIRVIKMSDGSADDGFESVPPGTFRLNNIPLAGGRFAVVTASTNGYGESKYEFANGVVLSDQPVKWSDLLVTLNQ